MSGLDTMHEPPTSLQPAFARLEDTHRLWHQAEAEYFEPDGFRVAVNACIQALRSVTFVLQKNKASIPKFDGWYQGWQSKLNADAILRWSVQARNRIVKEGDLELRSLLRVSVVASYDDPPYQEFSASPTSTTESILANLNIDNIPADVSKHGFLKLERRWVADSLPAHELLDALAHCYSVLSLLLYDACIILDSNAPGPALSTGTLPCMLRADEDRAIWVNLSTGAIEPIQLIPHDPTSLATEEQVRTRYGNFDTEPPPANVSPLRAIAHEYFQRARIMLQKDGYHGFFVFLLLPGNRLVLMQLLPEDKGDKYRMWREIANQVARTDAIGVIVIAEAWFALYDPEHPLRHAAEAPDRTEVLQLAAISKHGDAFSYIAPFSRIDDRIVLEETVEQDLGEANYFKPIRRVWAE